MLLFNCLVGFDSSRGVLCCILARLFSLQIAVAFSMLQIDSDLCPQMSSAGHDHTHDYENDSSNDQRASF